MPMRSFTVGLGKLFPTCCSSEAEGAELVELDFGEISKDRHAGPARGTGTRFPLRRVSGDHFLGCGRDAGGTIPFAR